jgi:hypothetical protein
VATEQPPPTNQPTSQTVRHWSLVICTGHERPRVKDTRTLTPSPHNSTYIRTSGDNQSSFTVLLLVTTTELSLHYSLVCNRVNHTTMSNPGQCPVDHGGNASSSPAPGSKCPVDHGQHGSVDKDAPTQAFLESAGVAATRPPATVAAGSSQGECPVDHGQKDVASSADDTTRNFLDIARSGRSC